MNEIYLKGVVRLVFALLCLSVVIYLLFLIFQKIDTVYNVTAKTEVIKCYSKDKPMSRINLFDAELVTLKEDTDFNIREDVLFSSFSGSIELNDSVQMKMERLAHGPLIVEFERPTGGVVANLREFNNKRSSKTTVNDILFVEIKNIDSLLQNNISMVIPFSGKVELGKSIAVESDGEYSLLLKEGDITMTGIIKNRNTSFVAGHEKLYLGDRLVFDDDNSIGIATISTEPAIQVSYRAVSEEARIIKPGPRDLESGYKFSATLFSRFKYDKLFQGLSLFVGVLITLITIGDFIFNHIIDLKNSSKS